jgi:hypothetical protein
MARVLGPVLLELLSTRRQVRRAARAVRAGSETLLPETAERGP